MKKIILSLVAILAALNINAQTDTKNVIVVYKNDSPVETYINSDGNYYRAELDMSSKKDILIYKYTDSDNKGSVVATYTTTSSDKYRADLKVIKTAGTAKTKDNLSVKWVQLWSEGPRFATVNVGATINDYTGITSYDNANVGKYYCWGASSDASTSQNYSNARADIQGTNYDTAKNVWGNNWKMLTKSQYDDLLNASLTKWEWCDGSTSQYKTGCTLKGWKITGVTNGFIANSIFLPAAGKFDNTSDAGTKGYYWTSSTERYRYDYYSYKSRPMEFLFTDGSKTSDGNDTRTEGYSIRAILDETAADPVAWVTGITISGSKSVEIGKSITLTAKVTPSNAENKGVYWSSSNENIATVDIETGKVTGVSSGIVNITATAFDDSEVSATYEVVVGYNLISGKFSVSSTKQVQFTKANVYWNGSAYMFENDQTDYPTSWDDNHVGLFHWVNTNDYLTPDMEPYAPCSSFKTGTLSKDDKFFFGEDNKANMTVQGVKGELYALSQSEWYYLIYERANASSLYKARVRVKNGTAEYHNCLLLAPDDYSGPAMSELQDEAKLDYLSLSYVNELGLVCLPAVGYIDVDTNTNEYSWKSQQCDDAYWTASPEEYNGNHYGWFVISSNAYGISASSFIYRNCACPIRLVR